MIGVLVCVEESGMVSTRAVVEINRRGELDLWLARYHHSVEVAFRDRSVVWLKKTTLWQGRMHIGGRCLRNTDRRVTKAARRALAGRRG